MFFSNVETTLRILTYLVETLGPPTDTPFQGLKTGRFDTPAGIPRILRAILNP